MNVLIADDDRLLNLMLATVVNAANLQVHLESSEDGSELCHAQWSKAVSKKLGQDGYRFKKLKASVKTALIPVLVLSVGASTRPTSRR